jgi:hypothetical protein
MVEPLLRVFRLTAKSMPFHFPVLQYNDIEFNQRINF